MARKSKYYQRSDGLFETSRTVNGKRVMFRGKTCAEVDRKILEFNEQKKRGRKVSEIADEWFASKTDISKASYIAYNREVERLKTYFPGYASDVKPLDIQRYFHDLASKGYAKGTMQQVVSVTKQVFSHAVIAGDIDFSPAREVGKPKKLPEKKRSALTVEQEQKINACRSGEYWLIGMMLLYTGCRRGELLALNWQDIDRVNGVVHIVKKLNYSGTGSNPALEYHMKSENGKRDIPLFKPLADALPGRRIGLVFPGKNGGYMTSREFYAAFDDMLKCAGIEAGGDSRITPHCFRHSFATICYEAGIDEKSAAAMLGDTEEVTRGVYQDLRSAHHASSAEKLNAFFAMREAEQKEKRG